MAKWSKQSLHVKLQHVDCPTYDSIKDFMQDPSGVYVLIRIEVEQKKIEVALCNAQHQIFRTFAGNKSQDLYHSIFEVEHEEGADWFQSKEHIAYLGKELNKAERALQTGQTYLQE